MIRSVTGSEIAASFAVCINTLSAAVAIWTLRSRAPRAMLQFGGSGLLAGVALLLVGAHLQSLPLVLGHQWWRARASAWASRARCAA